MTDPGPMSKAVADAVQAAQIPDGDQAAVALARKYAALLDAALDTELEQKAYSDLGPKLLAALTALGMTAAGRGVKGGGQSGAVVSKLDELRQRREQRTRVHAS